ncbi:hypothetical protein BLNAU_17852 [Blattamonas nauphoetae]|uniref:Uncharacterized protein n=1 Tax=Blattamonas nauphoetae TaxID=2049346 RepID=A0ABQ9X6I9_9EUKA|nr:hypothetical protein BLNAU_17852 [Blattamonas nauphoetae]
MSDQLADPPDSDSKLRYMTSANNTTLYVLHETLTLQVDLAHQSIQGIAELDLYNQDSFLNGIRLNARQMSMILCFTDNVPFFHLFSHFFSSIIRN